MNQTEMQVANRRAAWKWGSIVVGLLSLQVAGGVVAIILATGDESVAIVPDYHQKALLWDDEMAVRRASEKLDWHLDTQSIRTPDSSPSKSGLAVTLTGPDGQPIDVTGGTLRFYRHVRAQDVRQLPIPAGRFSTLRLDDCFNADGLWEVIVDVTDTAGNRFVETVTLNVDSAAATEST